MYAIRSYYAKSYRRMTLINGSESASMLPAPLLSAAASDRTVTIRPFPLGEEYPAEFTTDKGLGTEQALPLIWRTSPGSDGKPKSFEYRNNFV